MRGHIQRRGKHSWRLKFDVGRDPAMGKRLTKYVTVRGTKRDAQRELNRILHEIDTDTFVEPAKITVGEYLQQWLVAHASQSSSPKTVDRYAEIIKLHLIPAFGSILLPKLKPLHIEGAWAAALKSGRHDGRGGLSPQTVVHHHRLLHQALSRAVKWEMLSKNPAASVDPPKVPRQEIRVLSELELAALLKAVEGGPLHVPVLLAATTGLRRGEVLGLRWRDLDLDRGVLAVTQTLGQTRDKLYFKAPKTKSSRRTITLPGITVEELRRHKLRQLEERLMLSLGRDDDRLVFTRPDGTPIPPTSFSRAFSELIRRAGLPAVTFHGLRHSHMTHLLRAGVHPKVASERAGHSSVAITMDIYSHVLPGLQEDAANRVDAALRTALKQ